MRVLLAIDGSEQSYEAARTVGCLTSVSALIVLHVIDLPRLTYPMLGPDIAKDLAMSVEQAMRIEGERVLKRTMAHLSHQIPSLVKRLESGRPAEVILSIAQEEAVDLIMAGTRGLGEIKGSVLGSVSRRILIDSPTPVLIIKAPLPEVRRILLPVQGPQDAESTRRFLTKRPFPRQAHVTVFTVVPIPRSILRMGVTAPEAKIQQALESAEHFNDSVVAELSGLPYSFTGLVGMGAPAETILEQEATTPPDLILMGTHNPSAVRRLLLGSVSYTVLHQSISSILVVR